MDQCHSSNKEGKIDMFKIPAIENKLKKQQKIRTLPKKKQKFSHTKIDNMAREWENFVKNWGPIGGAGTYTVFVSPRCCGKSESLRRTLEEAFDSAIKVKGK